ncbi:MAG: cupin domain-containing protein [Candidatus Krumholzibacteria bacterium]|nr:cupin domain-containing protein [Candidatus Krumholzibacteria bacterium]
MKISDAMHVEAEKVTTEGAENVTIRWLISEKDGADRFHMRLFEIEPGGKTPLHSHAWEHEVYILEGRGKLIFEDKEKEFSGGFFIFVPEGKEHSFINIGDGTLKFLCLVPALK